MYTLTWIPDVEAAFRRFPVAVLILLGGVLLMLTFAWGDDSRLIGELRPDGGDTPPARFVFLLALTGLFWAVAIEFFGSARGWRPWLRHLVGLGTVAALAGLALLPDLAPVLAARWLPFDLWRQFAGAAMLMVALSATGSAGHDANLRILRTLTILGAAPLLMWLLVVGFSGVLSQGFPILAAWFGAPGPGEPLSARHQVLIVALAVLAGLGWIAAGRQPATDAGSPPSRFAGGVTMLLRQFVFPLLLLAAVLFCLQLLSLQARWLLSDRTTRSTWNFEPGSVALMMVIGVFVVARELPDRDKGLTRYALLLWPWVAVTMAAATVFGLAIDVPMWLRQFDTWGHTNWSVVEGLFIHAFPLCTFALVWFWPRPHDLRLVLLPWAVAILLSGFGPWTPDHQRALQFSAGLERDLTAAGLVEDGRLRQEWQASWTEDRASRARANLNELSRLGALGLLAPLFEGTDGNPFAGPPGQSALRGRILGHLEVNLRQAADPAELPATDGQTEGTHTLPGLPTGPLTVPRH